MNSRPGPSLSNSVSPQNGLLFSLKEQQINDINNNRGSKPLEHGKLREPQILGHEYPVQIKDNATP